ncbi:unnamed protein product [Tetraodon nigroviridis]|uniref:(spotted green pufferfish) hypothetical protein n=1 Tax=Tetraodon nigroviridis TaxID=99883 RepID=Q4T9A9_TETNG|nr:unnamed protein product [Tetraodon nigroviridis]
MQFFAEGLVQGSGLVHYASLITRAVTPHHCTSKWVFCCAVNVESIKVLPTTHTFLIQTQRNKKNQRICKSQEVASVKF